MKLYHHTTKRIAKKVHGGYDWKALNAAKDLKVGDMIHTCKGWNDIIRKITPEWFDARDLRIKRGRVVIDIAIETDSTNCSVILCCTLPVPTKDQIMEYWKRFSKDPHYGIGSPWYKDECFGKQSNVVMDAVAAGKCPFDEKGMLLEEFKIKEEPQKEISEEEQK